MVRSKWSSKIKRKIIDKLKQTYGSEFANKDFAYDEENIHTKTSVTAISPTQMFIRVVQLEDL